MKGLYAWVGFNSTAIDYEPLPRADGKSNFGPAGIAVTGVDRYFGVFDCAAARHDRAGVGAVCGGAWLRQLGGRSNTSSSASKCQVTPPLWWA